MEEKKAAGEWLYRGKILDLKLDLVVLPNGRQTEREVVVHPGAVAVVAVNNKKRILLLKQFRYAVGQVLWELPAGKLEQGEDPLACAKRELAEETGYGAGKWEHLSTFYTSPGFCSEIMFLYLASDLSKDGRQADEDEFIEVRQIPLGQALKWIQGGKIKDAKTIAGILLAEHKLVPGG